LFEIIAKDKKGKIKEKREIERTSEGKKIKIFKNKNGKLELESEELAGVKTK